MKVVEIRDQSELSELRSAWDSLLLDSPGHSIFVTWEWTTAWWSAYGHPGALRILAAIDDTGTLRGIAPLRSESVRRYRQSVPALRFLADGSNDSDYLDCVVCATHEQEVREAFNRYWREQVIAGTALILNCIPETSATVSALTNPGYVQNVLFSERSLPCATVQLPQNWEDYLTMLKPRFRTKVRSVLRNIESRTEAEFGFCETEEQARNLLPQLFELHTRRWRQQGKPGVFARDKKRDFYFRLSALFLARGWLRFSWLKWNNQVIACQYGFVYCGAYSQLQEGYEPATDHYNPGIALRAWSIREFIRAGIHEYDFLEGIGRHKSDWGAETKFSKNIVLARNTWTNRIFVNGSAWEEQAKNLIAENVPERVLVSARKWLSSRKPAAPSSGTNPEEHSKPLSVRESAANCYFYLRLPKLVRPLRNRYQLGLQVGGRRRFSWTRRTHGGVRILYYHRVNDDNDPFFHAISTTLFEQEMRYISRHYKVLSLGDALKHLESDSTETVLAVTFDDGYQDNYINAFPILQQYGLPATIFLTTGNMDSGEPLWFERLALAIKMTPREFIDIEVDIPRRLSLVTTADRLAANHQIFALLRRMPDADRRQWLDSVLQQLRPKNEDSRRGKLLTWDQVRLMKRSGIDFGGHTVTHPFISRLTREGVMTEVVGCKRRIEDELQLPVEYFAYPNGREEDFGVCNKELIRAAGYRAAVTTIWGINDRSTDLMELRRGGPWETTLPQFAYKLDWYQLVND